MQPPDTLRIENDTIRFGEGLALCFQRTLRIPDDGRSYPLPPGLGTFPLRRVDDYRDRVPSDWLEHGGVFLPMFQREAMWISFQGQYWKPRAVKVGVGKVCAITGQRWSEALRAHPQDYVVTPPQPWLDGICVKEGSIRQFVAMPLGMGYTVEGQVTGEEVFGGVQIKVFETKPGRFPDAPPTTDVTLDEEACYASVGAKSYGAIPSPCAPARPRMCAAPAARPGAVSPQRATSGAMGIAAGGTMKQKVYPDPYGIDTWDASQSRRVFVHIVNSELWREITGEAAPTTPVTAREYARHGLPWFAMYDESVPAIGAQPALTNVKSIRQLDADKSPLPLQDDTSVEVGIVKKIWTKLIAPPGVRDGKW